VRSDLVRQLLVTHAQGDDTGFHQAARELIAEERRQKHRVLAAELEHALLADRKPGAGRPPLTLRPVPRSRDERPLIRLAKPDHDLAELVLSPDSRVAVEEVIRENLSRMSLASYGLHPRQRLLFVGPPGTGKSATAHAIATELSLPVAIASLAAVTSSFLGDTARNLDAIVRFAEQTPCVLVFDEFDVLGQERGQGGDHGEMRRVAATVLQLLEEACGESVIVATSNHPRLIDAAVWRRFDELVIFDKLGRAQLAELIELKLRAYPATISTTACADELAGLSPAEVELVCRDAMRRAVLANQTAVDDTAFGAAVARVRARRAAIEQVGMTMPEKGRHLSR
jgi:SpoVK/Ycf46/Vps4 family AAA+-type ATPase